MQPRTGLDLRILSVRVAGAAFLVALLIVNRDLFTKPLMAYSDFAANGLQVERAKHFRELLGNYSRWGFHHPGPAFMYLWACGEAFLHDLLHIAPSAMNAHMLTTILLNTAFLFGTIGIVSRRCKSYLFMPTALGLSLFFIYILNHTVSASAILSIWMPHVLLFPFLFLIASSAAVAMGETSQLPWFVLTGLLLLHGHTAQPLFVGPIALLTFAMLWHNQIRIEGWQSFFRDNRPRIVVSIVFVLLFALPVVIDVLIHRPNNIRAIIDYTSTHKGIQNKPRVALKYELSFFDFTPAPEIDLQQHPTHLISDAGAKPYVAAYWCLGFLILGLMIGTYARRKGSIPAFFKLVAAEILLVQGLFYVWSLKMAPPLFNFNGYFIYGMQLLALFVAVALVLDGLRVTVRPWIAVTLCLLAPLSMFGAQSGFINTWTGDPETEKIYASLPPDLGPVHLTFPPNDWSTIVGVADQMKHDHRPFCVDDLNHWGPDNTCYTMDSLENLVITRVPLKCELPCRVLLKDDRFQVALLPYPSFQIPFAIKPDHLSSLNTNFFDYGEPPVWSSRTSSVYFKLVQNFTDASRVRVIIWGVARPGRPARILLNGHPLGMIVAGPSRSDFVIDRSLLTPGNNELTIQVDNAVRVGSDPRILGFLWDGLEFQPAE